MNAREITSAACIALWTAVWMTLPAATVRAQTPPAAAASDDRLVAAFLSTLRRGVAGHDAATVARVFQFPITVNALFQIPVRNAADLAQYYDAFFTDHLVRAIACGPVQRSGGTLTINKQLFAEKRGDAFKVTRMTAHPMPPRKAVKPPAPRRVIFPARGYRLARYAGTLQTAVESYVIWVRKNEVLRATLTGFKGRPAAIRLLNEQGLPIDARAGDVARTWVGPVPETGDYRIDVVRRAGQCDPAVVYDLAISLQ